MRALLLLLAPLLAGFLAAPMRAQSVTAEPPAAFSSFSGRLAFAENRGQWPDEVLFLARLGGGDA